MADHDDRHAARFSETGEVSRRFTHLRNRPRRRLDIRHVHHLNGVDHHQFRLFFIRYFANLLDAGFRQHIHVSRRQTQTVCTHRHLLQRFFPGDVQGFHVFAEMTQNLQQQRTFTCAGVTTNQNRTARHYAAA
ncbi:hypothetical protein SRABI106_02455 [Rahnella aquatilis]|nr:hypothetical protein SRABI106_02455 [Rahnella aquatilis]